MRIGFAGQSGAGKTTVAQRLAMVRGGRIVSLATPLKNVALTLGWDGKKDDRGRQYLQKLGQLVRWYDPDFWVDRALRAIEMNTMNVGPEFNVYIDDVRFPNEVQKLRDNGFIIVYLNGRGLPDPDAEWRRDESELLDRWTADYIVQSDRGKLAELHYRIDALYELLLEEEAHKLGG